MSDPPMSPPAPRYRRPARSGEAPAAPGDSARRGRGGAWPGRRPRCSLGRWRSTWAPVQGRRGGWRSPWRSWPRRLAEAGLGAPGGPPAEPWTADAAAARALAGAPASARDDSSRRWSSSRPATAWRAPAPSRSSSSTPTWRRRPRSLARGRPRRRHPRPAGPPRRPGAGRPGGALRARGAGRRAAAVPSAGPGPAGGRRAGPGRRPLARAASPATSSSPTASRPTPTARRRPSPAPAARSGRPGGTEVTLRTRADRPVEAAELMLPSPTARCRAASPWR